MKKIEIKDYYDLETKQMLRVLYVADQLFDWNIDGTEIEKAKRFCKTEESRRAIHANIQNHFLECFSTFMRRPVTLEELNLAIEKGVIND